jgi:hypothetical protein
MIPLAKFLFPTNKPVLMLMELAESTSWYLKVPHGTSKYLKVIQLSD